MSREFETRDGAFLEGLCMVRRYDLYCVDFENVEQWSKKKDRKQLSTIKDVVDAHPDAIKFIKGGIEQFGNPLEDSMIVEVKSSKGMMVNIGTSRFRDGFDCWICDPNTGFGMRL